MRLRYRLGDSEDSPGNETYPFGSTLDVNLDDPVMTHMMARIFHNMPEPDEVRDITIRFKDGSWVRMEPEA